MGKEQMKILVYSSVFYPAIGGIENHTLFLVNEFVKAGHIVKVVTEQKQDPAKPLVNVEIIHSSNVLGQLKLFFWSDLVYMPNITLKGVWLFAFNPFKKWVISHNDFSLQYTANIKAKLKKFFIARANVNIAVSQCLADFLPVPCKVIYNCYDDAIFKIYPEEKRQHDIVFVGRLVSQKGCALLIDACAELDVPYTLTIIGDGYEYESLNHKVRSKGLEDKIKFHGFKKGEELARCLNQHKIMVVPSLDVEGFGIVALEGLACGCNMIVSEAGGLAEAVKGHAYTFQMGDKKGLLDALKKCLDPNTLPISNEADKTAYLQDHSRKKVAEYYLETFKNALNR
ncbi:MAG TPA: glycosyltransferase family 4 protein [Bacteroidia bacterium]